MKKNLQILLIFMLPIVVSCQKNKTHLDEEKESSNVINDTNEIGNNENALNFLNYIKQSDVFNEPIFLKFPRASSKEDRDSYKNYQETNSSGWPRLAPPEVVIIDWDPDVLLYLAYYKLANIEKVTRKIGTRAYYFYNPKFAEQIGIDTNGGLKSVGIRHNIKVIFHNEYNGKRQQDSADIKIQSIKFNYEIKTPYPAIKNLNKVYEGSAKAILNPDSGRWEVEQIYLEDGGLNGLKGRISNKIKELGLKEAVENEKPFPTANISIEESLGEK